MLEFVGRADERNPGQFGDALRDRLNEDRHNALADALVTAQLLLVAFNDARRSGDPSYDGLRSLERTYRYTSGKR